MSARDYFVNDSVFSNAGELRARAIAPDDSQSFGSSSFSPLDAKNLKRIV